ncbi:sensor histidine kinase [Roseofilum casamattae]|uniref:histidine kinase n=1 Tax=Roseofilum casamattae BLCC-M143 TaxID=3022442 RepID=A0ABT7BZM4_9CYAN|nr:HAMP domain-containing sensor histidine kinase [Roseofilum casamattae]MDJ1184621.1 HAMP domain-containing sensor histidine kinase [Roseofilum casamattae BLCC-M143]
MLRPASAEFVELCRSQITLLTQSFGASLSAVYLTERYPDRSSAQPIPIAVYPDLAQPGKASEPLALQPSDPQPQQLTPRYEATVDPTLEEVSAEPDRLILPLIEGKMLMGFLVTQRKDRQWNQLERDQIQHITQTLTIACLLDQRSQWLEHRDRENARTRSQRQDLFHNFLHQFRNPLTALGTFSKLLLKRLPLPDPHRSIAESLLRESDRLQTLLQNFSQAMDALDRFPDAEGETLLPDPSPVGQLPPSSSLGTMRLNLEAYAIAEILDPLLLSIAAIAEERHLRLHRQIIPNLPLVEVDANALTEVLNNVLENALKYTPTSGEIYVQVPYPAPERPLAIAISDSGPGIPAEDCDRIFDRHYRGIQADGDLPGTGLGLAIAKDLIEQMQGTINVFSPAIYPSNATKGTTFVITLPIP